MAVRNGMVNHILELRRMTDASATEVKINNVQYWTDDQLQSILDVYRHDVLDLSLLPASQREAGTDVTYRYYIPDEVGAWIENDATVFSVVDENGVAQTDYTYDGINRYILFSANTSGATRLLRCRFFDMRLAAARVWFEKAGHRVALIDWKAGGQNLNEDQEYQHCMAMFVAYSGSGGVKSIMPTTGVGSSKRLRKVGYGTTDSPAGYYPTGTEQGIKGPIA